MKKFFVFLMVLGLVTFTNYSQAQKMGVAVQGSVALPMGDFGDAAGTGFGGHGTFMYMLQPNIALTGTIGYLTWGPKESLPSGFDWSFSSIPILLGVRYSLMPGVFKPYLGAQLGLHMLSVESKSPYGTFSDSNSKFGFAAFVGFMYALSQSLMLDVNAGYNSISTEGSASNYLGINAGVAFPL